MEAPTFKTFSLGCRTNQAEIEEISESLINHGFTPALSTEAPLGGAKEGPALVIFNTCVVTLKAERETRKVIRKIRRNWPKAFLVVLGCGVDAKQKLKINLPSADLLISNKEKPNASKIILRNFTKYTTTIHCSMVVVKHDTNKYLKSGRKLLKIQDGCNRFCSYCIVPYLRGKPKSVEPKAVIEETNETSPPMEGRGFLPGKTRLRQETAILASFASAHREAEYSEARNKLPKQKIKEVILSGINLSLYGQDLKPKTSLFFLLQKILRETKIKRITLSSLDPEILDEEFIKLIIKNPRFSRFLHFSLQSGALSVLKRMNRKLNLKKFSKLLKEIKEKVPNFVFRADIIVGFPNETEKEFQETVQLIKLIPFSFIHAFPYSPRPGTIAFKKIQNYQWQDIPEKIKKERVKIILNTTKNIRKEQIKKLIGQTLNCLIIKKLKNGFWETQADNSWKVLVKEKNQKIYPGETKKVKITESNVQLLIGKLFLQSNGSNH